jgi:hypothetical protein
MENLKKPCIEFLDFEEMCNTLVDMCKIMQRAVTNHEITNDGGFYTLILMESIAGSCADAARNEFENTPKTAA